jgi:hypothetical protein
MVSGETAGETTIYVTAGTQVKFDNYLNNLGPDRSSLINYSVYLGATDIDSNTVTLNATQSGDVYSNTVDTTGDAAGTQYCEFISWKPVTGAGGTGTGVKVCAIVEPSTDFDITGYTMMSGETAGETTIYVTAGTQVKFDNYLNNLGPDRSSLINYSVYLGATDIDSNTVPRLTRHNLVMYIQIRLTRPVMRLVLSIASLFHGNPLQAPVGLAPGSKSAL